MLSQSQRTAILELHRKGVGKRQIARALRVSRQAINKVIRSQSTVPPLIIRTEKAEPHHRCLEEMPHNLACTERSNPRPTSCVRDFLLWAPSRSPCVACRILGISSPPIDWPLNVSFPSHRYKLRLDLQRIDFASFMPPGPAIQSFWLLISLP